MAKLRFWLSMLLAALFGALVTLGATRVVRVPDLGHYNYRAAVERLRADGLKARVIRSDGEKRPPLPAEWADEQHPSPGSLLLRGMTVSFEVERPDETVVVPDLIGRFENDAYSLLEAVGLSGIPPFRGAQVDPRSQGVDMDSSHVVLAQDPAPGKLVPFGSDVTLTAAFPHAPEGTDPRFKALHGVLYLRYGINGTERTCGTCHTIDTCTACHDGKAYEMLDGWHPDPR